MTTALLQPTAKYSTMRGMNTYTRFFKMFAVNLTAVLLLFVGFKVMLFGVIGWHDGLILDWYTVYYPSLQTADPFTVWGYFNPPWLAWMLAPLGVLSAVDSHVLWIVLILLLTVRCVYELGGGSLAVVLTIISPGFLVTIMQGQVDIFVLLGSLLGSWLLILVKPQVAGLAIAYDVIAERRIDWLAVAFTAVCGVVWFFFMARPESAGLHTQVNITPYPWGIPVGLALFWLSIRRRDKWLAALATFFFAPYMSGSSLLVYSAIGTSRYGRLFAVLFSVVIWALALHWFI